MRRTTAIVAMLFALMSGAFPARSAAQGVQTGTIRGTVVDSQGLPISGVTITLTSPALQGERTTRSDASGGYAFTRLPPGRYEISFESAALAPVRESTEVLLGLTVEQNVMMRAAGITEEVRVVAETPAPIATPIIGANYRNEEIDALATQRTLFGIAQLAPGLTSNTPNTGQVTINGAFAFDNIFMVNGVDVNDNLFGNPFNLFIEDAIEETQILTSGITAEYGRFTGGVINAITKSGGNTFSGSFRTNFTNPSWATETPFERCDPEVTVAPCTVNSRQSNVQQTYEGTVGGPIVLDRLWFFGAGRFSEISTSASLPQTNLPNTRTDTNRRGEVKLTGTLASNHTVQGGYLNNYTEQESRPVFPFTIDRHGVVTAPQPNWYAFTNYRGVLRNNLFLESQFSERRFKFDGFGGTSTDIADSPFFTLTQSLGHYNAPYFDATDPEDRNNRQFTGNLTYFLSTADFGRHELKTGYEFFRSQNRGGNSQSSTSFVFDADYATDAAGNPLLDAQGYLIPVFVPGESLIENWQAIRGAVLNVDTQSIFVQDHWAYDDRWSFDLGFRYERVRSEATGGILGLDTDTIVPRLAAAYDLQGNGSQVIRASYGWYSGRANEAQIGVNTNVGNPDLLFGIYTGPAGQGRDFAPGLDPNNYDTILARFPTANVSIAPGTQTALVKEFTASYGLDLFEGRGYAEAAYVHRDTSRLIDDFIELANGTTNIVKDGVDHGTFTNSVYRNAGDSIFREYRGLLFQARFNVMPEWVLNGHYTVQLRNDGNYEGELANQPGVPSVIGDYPELRDPARHWPSGRTDDFQRHKLRVWSIYTIGLGRYGDTSVSGLWRVDSATAYSLVASGVPLTDIQRSLIAAYVDEPDPQDLYFGARGSELFKGYGVFDVSLNYNIPVFRTLRPWVKFDIYNAFNNQKLIAWNTTVMPDEAGPRDALGLPTGFVQGERFGKAEANTDFPIPFQTETGGRTYRLAVGFRF
jgi:outer membrane receptor protein involved in Fe transport